MGHTIKAAYGYGFCMSDIETTPEKVLALAALDPETDQAVREYLQTVMAEKNIEMKDLTLDDFVGYEGKYCGEGWHGIFYDVISLSVLYCTNPYGEDFLLFTPSFPWNANEFEAGLTKEQVTEIFEKFIRILTDEPIKIGYMTVQQG